MENNPNPSKQPEPITIPTTLVVDTQVHRKSHLDKLAEVFLPEDLDSIGNKVIEQVIIPAILKTAGDILHKSIDVIFGTNFTGVNTQTQQSSPVQNFTAYRNTSAQQQPTGTMQILPVRSGVYDYSEVRFRSIQDAQNVVNNMRAVLNNTGRCSVGKYLEFANAKTLAEDYNYGWLRLDNNSVYAQETGDPNYPYRIVLPPAMVLPQKSERHYL